MVNFHSFLYVYQRVTDMKKLHISSQGAEHVILNRQAMDTLWFNNENSGKDGQVCL